MTALRPLLVFLVIALFAASCETAPCELNFRTSYGGNVKGSTAMIFNSQGRQVMEVSSDINGNGYIKEIKAGTYTVKFKDATGAIYPAVRTVTLKPGDIETLIVELNDATEGGGAADTSGGTSGE